MDPLGDQLTTRPIQKGWEISIVPRLNLQFRFINNPARQSVKGSVLTPNRTRSDSPEPLLSLLSPVLETCLPLAQIQKPAW